MVFQPYAFMRLTDVPVMLLVTNTFLKGSKTQCRVVFEKRLKKKKGKFRFTEFLRAKKIHSRVIYPSFTEMVQN